jgi:hypothetical protein
MVAPAGYSCPRCASPLRWQADAGWACDACQVIYPAQGAAPAPPPPVSAAPVQPAPVYVERHALPGKTKIAIAAGIGAGALGLVAIAMIVLGGGSHGGKGSPREVFEAAIDRATAGDLDGLIVLTAAPRLDSIADCGDHVMRKREDVRSELREHLAEWKGLHVTVLSVDQDGSEDVVREGHRFMGCRLEHDLVRQHFKVKLHAKTDAGTEEDDELELFAARIGDGWYLDHGLAAAPAVGAFEKLTSIKDRMCACKDRTCTDAARTELSSAMQLAERGAHGSDDEHRVTDLMEQAMRCEEKVRYVDDYP